MKLIAGQVFAAVETIKQLNDKKVKLPFRGRVGLAQITQSLAAAYTEIGKDRDELIRKHGDEAKGVLSHIEVEKDGKKELVPNPKYAEFVFDFNKVLSEELEVDCPKVKLDDLGNDETDVDLVPLLPFIDDGKPAEAPKLSVVKGDAA